MLSVVENFDMPTIKHFKQKQETEKLYVCSLVLLSVILKNFPAVLKKKSQYLYVVAGELISLTGLFLVF